MALLGAGAWRKFGHWGYTCHESLSSEPSKNLSWGVQLPHSHPEKDKPSCSVHSCREGWSIQQLPTHLELPEAAWGRGGEMGVYTG